MTSIRNPRIPIVLTIPGGHLEPNYTHIIIQGEVLSTSNRFNINFLCGSQPEIADVALSVYPQFDVNWITRNSRIHKQWGEEESLSTMKFPLARNEQFSIEVFATSDSFMVAINGRHYCQYYHRVPINLVNTLHIKGDAKLFLIEFENASIYPLTSSKFTREISSEHLSTETDVPFTSAISQPWPDGREIQVYGRVKVIPNRFHVNLQQGCQSYPHPSIALHVNPRFYCDRQETVLNSWFGRWCKEEKVTGRLNPFRPNLTFVLVLRRLVSGFQVIVNDVQIADYPHRMSPDIVDSIAIDGDVVVHKVVYA